MDPNHLTQTVKKLHIQQRHILLFQPMFQVPNMLPWVFILLLWQDIQLELWIIFIMVVPHRKNLDIFSNLSALPNVPSDFWSGGGYTRTSDGVNAMLYGHDGNTNIGRIQFSTDTLISAYTTLPGTANYLSGNGDSTYSWYSGGYFRIITEEGRIYQQDTSTGSIFHISSNPWQRGPNNTGHKYYGKLCNENNGMGGPEQRNTKYNEKALV